MISVVVCTHNRAETLKKMLESFARQNGLNEEAWELLVVDNHSTDHTRVVIEGFQDQLSPRYFYEPCLGLSHARNRGVAEAQGEIVAFLDDDVLVSPDWLRSMRRVFEQTDADAVGGRAKLKFEQPPPNWLGPSFRLLLAEVDHGDKRLEIKDHLRLFGVNIAFRKEVLERHGGFATSLGRSGKLLLQGEETHLLRKIQAEEGHIFYEPKAMVEHIVSPERTRWSYIRRWHIGWGMSLVAEQLYSGNIPGFRAVLKAGFELLYCLGYPLRMRLAFRSKYERYYAWSLFWKQFGRLKGLMLPPDLPSNRGN
ncbi:MAG: glycosyltransferase family 2 protein [Sedimentisphaerales bacterium]|nr:glycosyltransferase family 2 protein [Sedimentisphaerales bacterium]